MKDYTKFTLLLKTEQDKEEFKTWVAFLKAGVFRKAKYRLQDSTGYCCLGVGCVLTIPEDKLKAYSGVLQGHTPNNQAKAPRWLQRINNEFAHRYGDSLITLNDGDPIRAMSHSKIADKLLEVFGHEL